MQKTFIVEVEGIGQFEFKRRRVREDLAIGAEYNRIVQGQDEISQWFHNIAMIISALKVQTVSAPAGWDIDEMDAQDESENGGYNAIMRVHAALRDKEDSFRTKPGSNPPARQEATENGPVVVQGSVQANG